MSYMFNGASSFNNHISEWDVFKVTNMSHMLHSASSFNQDVSKWDVSNVTDMSHLFFIMHHHLIKTLVSGMCLM